MKRTIILSVALLVVIIGCYLGWSWFRACPPLVFHSISVGDSEESVIDTLTQRGTAFHKGHGEGKTVYSHCDGFMGVYFYYVENGRVIAKAVD